MTNLALPALLLILGAFLLPLSRVSLRSWLLLGLPIVVLIWVWILPVNTLTISVGGDDAHQFNLFVLGRLFATAFMIISFIGNLFALRQASTTELSASMLYAGSAVGMVLSVNFVNLLIFSEMMLLGSTLVIFSAGTDASARAGMRYLVLHVLSGTLLFMGVLGLHISTGDLTLRALPTDTVYAWLILVSLLINAGAPPLSAWVSDAYPEASPSGAVYLSAFTTKAAVFALLAIFAGEFILIPVGLYMIFYGIIYALLENDMRRILTYSIVNQVGFMMVGIGIGSTLAINGAALHAFAHILYKALLLMSAGSVLAMTGSRRCTELGGLYRSMRLTTTCAIIGALAISSFPLTSGFISKPMISQSALDMNWLWLWLLLLSASAGVFLHAGIKFPWFVFFHKDSGLRPADPPLNMKAAMVLSALLCLCIGVFPEILYAISPWRLDYVPYTSAHVIEKLQLLLFGGGTFFVMLPLLKRTTTMTLDTDWFYRKGLYQIALFSERQLKKIPKAGACIGQALSRWIEHHLTRYFQRHQMLGQSSQSSLFLSWLLAILVVLTLLYY